ncbi:MAG: Arm DNA-binding domain-containing protein [Rubrivivax sp.]
MPLTDTACKNAHPLPGRPRIRLADSGGLYLEISPTGAKLWRWQYRFAGKEKRLALGAYPDIAPKQARADRDAARALLDAGTDPGQARKDDRAAQRLRVGNTFEAVARAWWAGWAPAKSARHADYVLRRLEADVFPGPCAR